MLLQLHQSLPSETAQTAGTPVHTRFLFAYFSRTSAIRTEFYSLLLYNVGHVPFMSFKVYPQPSVLNWWHSLAPSDC